MHADDGDLELLYLIWYCLKESIRENGAFQFRSKGKYHCKIDH